MKIRIELENNTSHSYFAGSTLTGFVVLELPAGTRSNGLKIKCVGQGKVRWSKGKGSKTPIYYQDQENYLFSKLYLIGSQNGAETVIPSGIQRTPFSFNLPSHLPSSFLGSFGSIEYYLQATLKRSTWFDVETMLNFTVNGLVDLNNISSPSSSSIIISNPIILKSDQSNNNSNGNNIFSCWSSSTRSINFRLKINHGGFVPGQTMCFNLYVSNTSTSKKINSISLSLIQGITYTAKELLTKEQINRITKIRFGGLSAGEDKTWGNIKYKCPALPPTGLGSFTTNGHCSKLIDVKYWIEFHINSIWGSSVQRIIPIIIGNIPLVVSPIPNATTAVVESDNLEPAQRAPANSTRNNSNDYDDATATATTADLMLPSYEEVVGGAFPPTYEEAKLNTQQEQQFYMPNANFKPKYPIYHHYS